MGLQEVVQPGSPGAFFKRDVQISVQPVDELQNHAGFCFDDAFHHHLAGGVPHSNRNTFLVHIHADIFCQPPFAPTSY
jgi:predicted xylose isomerase-like sugar epimerase